MLAGAIVGAVGAREADKFYEGLKGEIRARVRADIDKLRGKQHHRTKLRDRERGGRDRDRDRDDDRYKYY